jgi:hypothetical protein
LDPQRGARSLRTCPRNPFALASVAPGDSVRFEFSNRGVGVTSNRVRSGCDPPRLRVRARRPRFARARIQQPRFHTHARRKRR